MVFYALVKVTVGSVAEEKWFIFKDREHAGNAIADLSNDIPTHFSLDVEDPYCAVEVPKFYDGEPGPDVINPIDVRGE